MRNSNSRILWFVFAGIFLLNFFQSYFTELLPDEAYYWVYSQQMDWGYFDHPPMVAALIKLSSLLFENELGVRFLSGITLLITAFLTWKTVETKEKSDIVLFIMLFFSTALINAYGFITTPDTALILFVAMLLYSYKQYLTERSWWNYFLIAISMTGMLYSKYQAVLVILCIILSNPKILRDGKIWLAGLFTIILFLPHILWQIENDFPSIKYHLYERVANRRYKFEHTLMHFVNMIAIVGLTFPIIYKAFFKQLKTKDTFSKALIYIVFGFFTLFFFSSFRGRVQAQWLVPISFSLIILTYQYILKENKSRKLLYGLAIANFTILLVGRTFFAFADVSPAKLDTHGNKAWAEKLQQEHPNTPKFFVNSYQNTASYWYYSKEQPYYYQNFTGRKNHFTLIQKNKNLDFPKILVGNRGRTLPNEIAFKGTGKDSIYIQNVTDFIDVSKLTFRWFSNEKAVKIRNKNTFYGVLSNQSNREVNLDSLLFEVGFRHKKQRQSLFVTSQLISEEKTIGPNQSFKIQLNFTLPKNETLEDYNAVGVGIKSTPNIEVFRISEFRLFTFMP